MDTARAQVVRLLRSITNVTKTLDKVPGEVRALLPAAHSTWAADGQRCGLVCQGSLLASLPATALHSHTLRFPFLSLLQYWLFCKMEYADDCPEEYEPPHFEPAGDRAVGFFPTKPFAM